MKLIWSKTPYYSVTTKTDTGFANGHKSIELERLVQRFYGTWTGRRNTRKAQAYLDLWNMDKWYINYQTPRQLAKPLSDGSTHIKVATSITCYWSDHKLIIPLTPDTTIDQVVDQIEQEVYLLYEADAPTVE